MPIEVLQYGVKVRDPTTKEFSNLAALRGADGAAGPGVPAGGTDGDVLVKNGATDYDGRWTKTPPQMGNLAHINTGSTADKTYYEGDYLVYNGQLYVVTDTTISQGNSLNSGSGGNISAATVGPKLTSYQNKLDHILHQTVNQIDVSIDNMTSAEFEGIYLYDGFNSPAVTQNMPFTGAYGILFVSNNSRGGWYQAVLNIATGKIYRREYADGSWGIWRNN